MSDQQYFTPELSDLFAGYECECYNSREWYLVEGQDGWYKQMVHSYGDLHNLRLLHVAIRKQWIRTPYLTRQQIEAEGWKLRLPDDNFLSFLVATEKGMMGIAVRLKKDHRIEIVKTTYWNREEEVLFVGLCPSINEFRKICRLIGIEKKGPVKA